MTNNQRIWTANDIARQDGRRVLVTGGVSGIGFQVARVMGTKGARVLVAGRDAAKGKRAIEELRQIVPGGDFTFGQLDLGNLQSIAEFSGDVLLNAEPIDFLFNIAGLMAIPKRATTVDGFEMHMGTNHLGHFALTGRLLPALRATGSARVITVSAKVAQWANLDLSDLQSESSYSPMKAYSRSKLANVLFAVELNQRASSIGISSIAVDPGTANTSLQRHSSSLIQSLSSKVINFIGYPLDRVADPVVFAALVAVPGNDAYVGPTKFRMAKGSPGYIGIPKPARNADLRRALWERSEDLTGIRYDFS